MGGILTYSYFLTNQGPDPATGIIVSNTLPPTVIPVEVTVTNGRIVRVLDTKATTSSSWLYRVKLVL